MVKVVEEDEDDYTDIDEVSDEEDSNSEPSEDNLSEDELEQWYQQIKKQRENHIKHLKTQTLSTQDYNVTSLNNLV